VTEHLSNQPLYAVAVNGARKGLAGNGKPEPGERAGVCVHASAAGDAETVVAAADGPPKHLLKLAPRQQPARALEACRVH